MIQRFYCEHHQASYVGDGECPLCAMAARHRDEENTLHEQVCKIKRLNTELELQSTQTARDEDSLRAIEQAG